MGEERTLAMTWGRWGGIWFAGKRGLCWRLCLGFVAFTYLPAEMTQVLNGWLDAERYEKALRYMADYPMTGSEMTLHIDFQGKAREALAGSVVVSGDPGPPAAVERLSEYPWRTMPPKTPKELREQVEQQNERPAKEGHERTAEGMSVETPKRSDFFGNLDKLANDERGNR